MNKGRLLVSGKFVVGGLHLDDFEWASKQYGEVSYVLVAYMLDCDGYHWRAVYVRAEELNKTLKGRIFGSKYS